MALGPRLDLRPTQSLVMTPQLQQAIKLLALSNLEIEAFIGETLDIVDRACIIYGGQVLFAGSPEDLVADANVRRLYLGESFTL